MTHSFLQHLSKPGVRSCARVALRTFAVCSVLGWASIWPVQSSAQVAWPSRPINVISGFATGGSVDVITRFVTDQMSRRLGQPMVINTVAGAGGTIGSSRAALAQPDGYTVLAGSSGSNAAAYSIYQKLAYGPDDFEQIGLMAIIPAVIVVRKDLPAGNFRELVAYAKANPGKLSFGHPGVGSSVQLQCELFRQVAGVDVQMVPYRGAGPVMSDLIGGQIDGACDAAPSSSGPVNAGQIRAMAVLGDRRATSLPHVPTTAEEGIPALQGAAWVALFAPKGTPIEVVARLNQALREALETPLTKQRFAQLGTSVPLPVQQSTDYANGFVRDEIVKWAKVAKDAQIPKQ